MKTLTSTNCSRRGLTLIEVIAGLALMGILLAGMLNAKSRFTRQHQHAQRVLIAVDALDRLLIKHWSELGAIEADERGEFEGRPDMFWKAGVVNNDTAGEWHCRVVRIKVFDTKPDTYTEPLVSVELMAIDPAYLSVLAEEDRTGPDSDAPKPPAPRESIPEVNEPVSPTPHILGVTR
jgi:prepilin-type N-terminal cleavage/methylation domain-containing protein